MEQLEFCTFLLHVGNELTAKQFEQLKFFLKGFISSGTCKEIQEVCHNFEERERELFLTPAHLGILKMALDAIGRPDLVKKIEEKEQYFTDLFRQQVQAGDNLEPRGYDAVCDGIEMAAGNLEASSCSDHNTPDDPHGTMVEEKNTVYGMFRPASNAKEPAKDECLSPTFPKGTIQPIDVPIQDTGESKSSSEGTPGDTDYGAHPFGSEAQKMKILQQVLEMFGSSAASSADSPLHPRSYDKGGYSVVISNGTLYESSDDKGVVMMESGAQFHIAIANNNVHAAEVDITFGGIYLGAWVVEANRSLSNPLIIEGSAWAPGRLTYISALDPNRPPSQYEVFGKQPEFDSMIDLEFKPETLMLKLLVQHVRKEALHEIFMPDYETATVGDLKKVINETLTCSKVSCLVKNSSEILQEDKTMSSLALENSGEVIQVLHMTEELLIESAGMDPVTMMVDPFDVSPQKIKQFIAQEIKIPVAEQRVYFEGQNIDEVDLLTDVLVKSKKIPVLKVDKDMAIKIKVRLPDGSEHEVEMNWFETVNALKKKMEALQICESSDTLKFNDSEISDEGRKQLIDLNFRNQSEVTVHLKERRSAQKGFPADEFQGSRITSDFGSSSTFPKSTIQPTDVPMEDSKESDQTSKKAKSTQHVPGQGPSSQKSQHPSHAPCITDPSLDSDAPPFDSAAPQTDPGLDSDATSFDSTAPQMGSGLDSDAPPFDSAAPKTCPGLDSDAAPFDSAAPQMGSGLDSDASPIDSAAPQTGPGIDSDAPPFDSAAPEIGPGLDSDASLFGEAAPQTGPGLDSDAPPFDRNAKAEKAFSTLPSGPKDIHHDSTESVGKEGIAMLYGNEENVSSHFLKDQGTWKFSKAKAVLMKIQLIDKRTPSASGSSTSSTPEGSHRPKNADKPKSTPTSPSVSLKCPVQ